MKDIARATGLSRAAVSMALRNDPSLPEATRERVKSAAAKIGYRPNPMVNALMASLRSGGVRKSSGVCTIAFLDLNPQDVPLYDKYFEGARHRANSLGYEVERFSLRQEGMSLRRIQQVLLTRRIQGLILPPIAATGEKIDLDWQAFSSVTLSYTTAEPISLATHHQYANMERAICELRQCGYKRIGFCTTLDNEHRVRGLTSSAYLHAHFLDPACCQLPILVCRKETFQEDFTTWLKKHRPDVLVGGFGLPYFKVFRELGMNVPDDIGFATLSRVGEHSSFAGMDEKPGELGEIAVDAVVAKIQRNETGFPSPRKIILHEGIWCDGPTVR